jgi:outer membrane protein OmpA-like peptidoglycan-associated protein
MKPYLLFLFLLAVYTGKAARQDTIPVYFATGKSVLTEGIQEQLAGLIYKDVLHNGQQLQIVGYADYVGSARSNDALSKARAAAVKRFLLGYGFTAKDITICIGKGEVAREGFHGNEGFTRDRRVDIVINPGAAPGPEPEPAPPPSAPAKIVAKPKPVVIEDIATAKPNETITLNNLYFYPGRHILRPESVPQLNRLSKVLEQFPTVRIGIEGHVCCTAKDAGDALDYDTHELALSVNRAKEVYFFLVKKGVAEDRMTFKGFGGSRPLEEEHSEEDADKNRRVEIRILER